MESCTHKLLETATLRTLHASSFSRSSTLAANILTDLLSRYLSLLSSTSAKYALHAGRTNLSIHDAISALDELGFTVQDLSAFAATDARDLSRYAVYSTRRIEDLFELRAQLADGLKQDRDDAIHLVYAPYDEENALIEEEEEEEEEVESEDVHDMQITPQKRPLPSSPHLPMSPISNPPSSPSRKRLRTLGWQPPEHIPDYLPPFPTAARPSSPILQHEPEEPKVSLAMAPPPLPPIDVHLERPPLSLVSQPILANQRQPQQAMSSAASDYLVQVPYSQSSLSSVPEWHLPSSVPPPPVQQHPSASSSALSRNLPTPQTEHSLIAAFHYILTHPPPPHPLLPGRTTTPAPAVNVPIGPSTLHPARHKVAMTLLYQTQALSRWEPADSLFATVAPCSPRVAAIGPTYPLPDDKDKSGAAKDFKFPPILTRPVGSSERIAPLVSQQTSRIPELARHILPPMIFSRTSRLGHPPILYRGTKPLTYGQGIPAPWNSNQPSSDNTAPPSTPATAKPGAKDALPNGKDKDKQDKDKDKDKDSSGQAKSPTSSAALPDARLYVTWDYEPKDYRLPLTVPTRSRTRMGTIGSMASPSISSPLATVHPAGGPPLSGLRSRSSSRLGG